MKIRRTLEHILVGTTIVATTVDGAYAGSFQQLEALYSSKASCVEISEVEMTLNNVEIKKAHIYDATGKYPIYVVGYIPTSDKDKIKKAQAIERGEEDHVFKQMVDDLNETSLKHGFRILSPEKQKEIAEKFKKIVIYYNTHDTLPPLHFPKKVYDQNLASYVKGGYVSGLFSIKGRLKCINKDMLFESLKLGAEWLDEHDYKKLPSLEEMEEFFSRLNTPELLAIDLEKLTEKRKPFMLYLEVDSIKSIR